MATKFTKIDGWFGPTVKVQFEVLEPAPEGVQASMGRLVRETKACGCWADYWENGPARESGKCAGCERDEQFRHESGAYAVAQAHAANDYYFDQH